MTATVSAREQRRCAISDTSGAAEHQAEEAWQLVDASHELRTPLTALRTEVELALLGNRTASELRAALTSAAEEIRRVCRLADDILVLARADHGRLPLRLRPLQPRGLLEAAAARARGAAQAQGRELVVRDTAPGSWLLADPDRAAQALDNLLSNALQYGSGTISLTACTDGRLLGLRVTDQGTGFAEDIAAHAFERFTRGRRAPGDGSGLGLSLVAAIASAHHGVATVRNLPEGGADACISLPRCLPAAEPALRAKLPPDAATLSRELDSCAADPDTATRPARCTWRWQPANSGRSRSRSPLGERRPRPIMTPRTCRSAGPSGRPDRGRSRSGGPQGQPTARSDNNPRAGQ
jgi:K+-sensing histidine kinase KdpD